MFRVIVAGSRTFDNYELLCEKLDKLLQNKKDIVIVSGGSRGADTLGEYYAIQRGYKVQQYLANSEALVNNADAAVIFWGGISNESDNLIDLAKQQGLQLRVITY